LVLVELAVVALALVVVGEMTAVVVEVQKSAVVEVVAVRMLGLEMVLAGTDSKLAAVVVEHSHTWLVEVVVAARKDPKVRRGGLCRSSPRRHRLLDYSQVLAQHLLLTRGMDSLLRGLGAAYVTGASSRLDERSMFC
jgi:hypothetical protein